MIPHLSLASFNLATLSVICGVVLVVAVAAVRLSSVTGLPSLLLYVLLGVFLGETGMGVEFENFSLAQDLSYLALVLIIAEGGLTASWREIKGSVVPAAMLSTVGVGLSIGVIGLATHIILDWPWALAMLVGAILSSTDAAAVFSVLRHVPLPRRVTGVLEAESGFNDAPVIIAVSSFAMIAAGRSQFNFLDMLILVFIELVGGVAIGGVVGVIGVLLLRHAASAVAGVFPLGVVACTVLAFGAGQMVHVSGFMAVYVSALVLGNSGLAHRTATRGFAQATGWLAQIGLFVMLGLLVSPSELPSQLGMALALGALLLLVARPVSVIISLAPFGHSLREMAFLSWAGLRGAVPIVAATIPMLAGVPNTGWLFNVVFVLVVIFTLIQAPALPWMARLLRIEEPQRFRDLDIETTTLDGTGAVLVEVSIGDDSRMHGAEVFELRLPEGAAVAMINRDGGTFVPHPNTSLRRGDVLVIVTPPEQLGEAQDRLDAVDAAGRLAPWSRNAQLDEITAPWWRRILHP